MFVTSIMYQSINIFGYTGPHGLYFEGTLDVFYGEGSSALSHVHRSSPTISGNHVLTPTKAIIKNIF